MTELDPSFDAAMFFLEEVRQALEDARHPQAVVPCPVCRARKHVNNALFELREAQFALGVPA